MVTNRRFSCTSDTTGKQLGVVSNTPIETVEKMTNTLEKYISDLDQDDWFLMFLYIELALDPSLR